MRFNDPVAAGIGSCPEEDEMSTQRVRNFLSEFSKPMSGSELGPEDYREVLAVLKSTLSTSTTSGSPTYRVPTTHNLLIHRIVGFVAMNDVSTETLAVSTVGNPSVVDRDLIKGGNCRVDLMNSDRKHKIIDEVNVPLSLFMKAQGIEFPIPHVVPAGETVEATLALQDTETGVVGSAAQYGIVLVATLIRVKAS